MTEKKALNSHVTSDPDILGGEPTIIDTRITCRALSGRINGGETIENLLEDYPYISKAAIEAALEYAREQYAEDSEPSGKPWRT